MWNGVGKQKPTFRHEIYVSGTCFLNNPISDSFSILCSESHLPSKLRVGSSIIVTLLLWKHTLQAGCADHGRLPALPLSHKELLEGHSVLIYITGNYPSLFWEQWCILIHTIFDKLVEMSLFPSFGEIQGSRDHMKACFPNLSGGWCWLWSWSSLWLWL